MLDTGIVRDGDAPAWTPEMFARAIARKGLRPVPKRRCYRCALIPTSLNGLRNKARVISHA